MEKTVNKNNEKIGSLNTQVSILDQEILEKHKQLTVFEVDINALDYGLYNQLLILQNPTYTKKNRINQRTNSKKEKTMAINRLFSTK